MPVPDTLSTFSANVQALERIEQARKAREDRMRNALEILADGKHDQVAEPRAYAGFVKRTAREGLGRDVS